MKHLTVLPSFAHRMNSREEVTIRNRTTLMTCPVMPAAVTKQMVRGSWKVGEVWCVWSVYI